MGSVPAIGFDKFPRQGNLLGQRATVCFNYDAARTIEASIIREDIEEPFRTILRLDDGRVVLATECQYSSKGIGGAS